MSLSSAKKLLLAGRGIALPFSMSGGFNNSEDGWTNPTGQPIIFDTTRFRSFPTSLYSFGYLERTFPGQDVAGLRITLSHWYRGVSGSGPITMTYVLDNGPEVEFARLAAPETDATFRQFQGTFVNPGKRNNTLRIRFSTRNNDIRFDDWSLTGARP